MVSVIIPERSVRACQVQHILGFGGIEVKCKERKDNDLGSSSETKACM